MYYIVAFISYIYHLPVFYHSIMNVYIIAMHGGNFDLSRDKLMINIYKYRSYIMINVNNICICGLRAGLCAAARIK